MVVADGTKVKSKIDLPWGRTQEGVTLLIREWNKAADAHAFITKNKLTVEQFHLAKIRLKQFEAKGIRLKKHMLRGNVYDFDALKKVALEAMG